MSTIKLLAQDGEITKVDLEVARISPTIRAMLDNLDEEGVIPLPNFSTPVLKKVMEWVAHHKDDYPPVEDDNGEVAADVLGDAWDTQFLEMDVKQLCDLLKRKPAMSTKAVHVRILHGKDRSFLTIPCYYFCVERLGNFYPFHVAHYLDIKVLINMGAKKMAGRISGCQNPEEVRALLNVENDFSPEEEEQTQAVNEWCMSSME